MVDHLPKNLQERFKKSDSNEKTMKYIFIDDFEFLPWTTNQYLDLFNHDNTMIIANSTINDDLDQTIANHIDNSKLFKFVCKTNADVFGDEYKQLMMMYLNNDNDVYRREVLLDRK